MNESGVPVAQTIRRIRFSKQEKLVAKLEELEKLSFIERVEGPTSWINLMVVVEKPSGYVQPCLDMRHANNAISIKEKAAIPNSSKDQENSMMTMFSLNSLNMTVTKYNYNLTLWTLQHLLGPKVCTDTSVSFSVSTRRQHIMWQICRNCPGVYNLHDDLIVATLYIPMIGMIVVFFRGCNRRFGIF